MPDAGHGERVWWGKVRGSGWRQERGRPGTGARETCGLAQRAKPRAWGADRMASGAQPAAAMGRGAGCAYAVVSGRRRNGPSPRAGRCRGRRSSSPRPCGYSLLGRSGEQCSNPTFCPGNRDHAPGICSMAKPRKMPKTVLPVLRPDAAGCQRKSAGLGASEPKVLAAC